MAGGALAATAAASPQPCASLHTCHSHNPCANPFCLCIFLRLLLIDVGIRPSPKATLSHGLSCPTALSPPACPAALQAGMPTQTVSFASASTLRAPHFAHNRPRHQHMSLAPHPLAVSLSPTLPSHIPGLPYPLPPVPPPTCHTPAYPSLLLLCPFPSQSALHTPTSQTPHAMPNPPASPLARFQ